MILLSIKFIFLFIIAYIIKNIYDLLDYNKDASLIKMDIVNKERIKIECIQKNPILLTYPIEYTTSLKELNNQSPGYVINDNKKLISLDLLMNSDTILIHKIPSIISDFNLDSSCDSIYNLFRQELDVNRLNYVSIYKGYTHINLSKNINTTLLFKSLNGSFTFHIFNPKHENEIKGEPSSNIKKWGIKIILTPDKVLYIPPEWSYIYESKDENILLQIENDTYPTILYNYIRKK